MELGQSAGVICSTVVIFSVRAVRVAESITLWRYSVGAGLPLPALMQLSKERQFTAAMKSLSFCDAFTSSSEFACSVLYVVRNIQPSLGPLPARARS